MLIAVLAGVIMFQLFKPMFRSLSHSVNDAVKVQQQGLSLWNAIGRYKSYTGSYPNKLEDLVPKYLENFNSMHSAVDTNRDPNHVSWEYFKPSQNADPSAPILREDYKMQNPATTDPNLAIQQSITITVGGKIVPHTSTVPQPTWHG